MILKDNRVKLEDGTVIEANWSTYEFHCKDGTTVRAKYADYEIQKMKLQHPEIKWN